MHSDAAGSVRHAKMRAVAARAVVAALRPISTPSSNTLLSARAAPCTGRHAQRYVSLWAPKRQEYRERRLLQ